MCTACSQSNRGVFEEQSNSRTHSSLLAFCKDFLGQTAEKASMRKMNMQNNNYILPEIHGEVMQQTPPPASISHCTPAALTPPNQREIAHTPAAEEESEWEREGEGVSSPPIIPFLSFFFFLSFALSVAKKINA